nr:uncharacterized protein LOC129385446 [Dermacentor andersoni]
MSTSLLVSCGDEGHADVGHTGAAEQPRKRRRRRSASARRSRLRRVACVARFATAACVSGLVILVIVSVAHTVDNAREKASAWRFIHEPDDDPRPNLTIITQEVWGTEDTPHLIGFATVNNTWSRSSNSTELLSPIASFVLPRDALKNSADP